MALSKLNKCIHCEWAPFGEWTDTNNGYRVECSNTNGCKAWVRIYSHIKKYAEETWNKANPKGEGKVNDS